MCEIKLNQILLKNPQLTNGLDRFISYRFFEQEDFIAAPETLFPQIQEFKHESINTRTFKVSVQDLLPISVNFIDQTLVTLDHSV